MISGSPILSIITVVRNSAATLEQAMLSVLGQKTPEIEYIVLDGNSSDGSQEIIRLHEAQLDYWHSKPDKGISHAFNQGIALANGQYIGLLNADDFYEPGILFHILARIKGGETADILHGQVRYHDPRTGRSYIEIPDLSRIRRFMSVYHPTMFVKREAYEEIGDYSESYEFAMDSEWVHRAIQSDLVFLDLQSIVTNMRLQGVSHQNLRKSLIEYRSSSIEHFNNTCEATYYYLRQSLLHTVLKNSTLRRLWLTSTRGDK